MKVCFLKDYRDIFGKPKTGVHQYRFLNTAVVDYILSFVLALFLAWLTNTPLVLMTIAVLIVGVILHAIFGVNTQTLRFFGIHCK